MTDLLDQLRVCAASALGRSLEEEQIVKLHKYLNLLIKWQRSQRLVGSTDPRWLLDNVIVDSLLFARALPRSVAAVCDVGSGAGLPGIPLKVAMPEVDVTLLEARARRASFLLAAIRELPLTDCRVVNSRLEDVVVELAGRFDAVVMRCAGNPTDLAGRVRDLLRPGGVMVSAGPPRAGPLSIGEWLEVEGPRGSRRFWVYRPGAAPFC